MMPPNSRYFFHEGDPGAGGGCGVEWLCEVPLNAFHGTHPPWHMEPQNLSSQWHQPSVELPALAKHFPCPLQADEGSAEGQRTHTLNRDGTAVPLLGRHSMPVPHTATPYVV